MKNIFLCRIYKVYFRWLTISMEMKFEHCFCLSLFLLLLVGCADEKVSTSKCQKETEANPNDFSLQEAHEFFDRAMELIPMTRSNECLRTDGVSFPPGEFNTLWNDARKGRRKDVVYYDFPIEPQMRYKVRRPAKIGRNRKGKQEVRVYNV